MAANQYQGRKVGRTLIYRLTAVDALTQVEINAMWSGLLIWTARNALVPPYGPWNNLIGCFMMW